MRNRIVLILLLTFLPHIILANEIKDNCERVIREYFNDEVVFSYYEYEIAENLLQKIERQCQQKFFKQKIVVWEILKQDTLHAIGLLDNVYGKSLPITFMTLFNTNGSVLKSDIIKYRESYGGGIADQNWLEQFNGKNNEGSFINGQDISIISGATISSHSITKGIRKLSFIIHPILDSYANRTVSIE
jgi:Na+-translocating ferredoxin:NAD+ oxidoreductase RnfG subunit